MLGFWIVIIGICSMIGSCCLTEGTKLEGIGFWFFVFSFLIAFVIEGAKVGDNCPWIKIALWIMGTIFVLGGLALLQGY